MKVLHCSFVDAARLVHWIQLLYMQQQFCLFVLLSNVKIAEQPQLIFGIGATLGQGCVIIRAAG